ncbi:unnamed protein product, partial [Mesorhabditis belari]|uniref:Uncharacterized protein n=1 Tax=Mesorhabditis belari TaxID=2138241 RepID=A0AAF3EUQ0_9BILA
MAIDEGPWRQDVNAAQGWPSQGAGPSTANWGHVSPAPGRNPWQDPNQLGQVAELPMGAMPTGTWAGPPQGGGTPDDFGKQFWQQDPSMMEAPQPFQVPPMHPQMAGVNGMVDGMGGDFMRGPEPMWDMTGQQPMKQEELWKQQQGGQWMPNGRGWPPQGHQMHLRQGPPPMRGPPMNGLPGNGWPPQGMMPGPGMTPPQGMGWTPQPGPPQGPPGGGGRGGMQPRPPGGPQNRRYPDVSVPPPIDIPFHGQMGMRGGPPPNNPPMWKEPVPGSGGMRNPQFTPDNQFQMPQEFGSPFGGSGKPQGGIGQFVAGQPGSGGPPPTDDLMWHDPNGELKKWQRDTGVNIWGDPDKASQRAVKLWKVEEGTEEDYEMALQKCPVPRKTDNDSPRISSAGAQAKRTIVPTGWGDLPDNDPNKKTDDHQWAENLGLGSSHQSGQSGEPQNNWSTFIPQQPFSADPTWSIGANGPSGGHIENIAEKLRVAVEKGFLDLSNLQLKQLPPAVLPQINSLLTKLPEFEMVEKEMGDLIEGSRPEGQDVPPNSPKHFMSEMQKMEYDRLMIQVTTLKIELGEMSKKIRRQLNDSGIQPAVEQQFGSEPYYPFLDESH